MILPSRGVGIFAALLLLLGLAPRFVSSEAISVVPDTVVGASIASTLFTYPPGTDAEVGLGRFITSLVSRMTDTQGLLIVDEGVSSGLGMLLSARPPL